MVEELAGAPEPVKMPGLFERYKKYAPAVIIGVLMILGGLFSWSKVTHLKESREEVSRLTEKVSSQQIEIVALKETVSTLTDQKRVVENNLLKIQKDMERNYSRKKYDRKTGNLIEDVSSGSHSSETSSDETQRMTEEILSLAEKITQSQAETDVLKTKLTTTEKSLKTALEKDTKSRGGFGIDGGAVVVGSSIKPKFGVYYSILTIPLINFDLAVSAGYVVDLPK